MLNTSIDTPQEAFDQAFAVLTGPTADPVSPHLSGLMALVIAGVLVFVPAVWNVTGLIVTLVHELGHAYAGLITGRGSVRIRLSSDHSGLTTSRGSRASAPFSTFWGYPVPALVGAGLVGAAVSGWAGVAVGVGTLLVVVSAVFMRGVLAWAITGLTVISAAALVIWVQPGYLAGAVLGLGVFFLVGAVRGFGNLVRVHGSGRAGQQSDAAFLARDTGIPAGVWLLLMGVIIAGCVGLSAWVVLS